jgi:hypothetical protein
MAHLGIWSRKDPFAPMLDPLIAGLKARGFCFARLPNPMMPFSPTCSSAPRAGSSTAWSSRSYLPWAWPDTWRWASRASSSFSSGFSNSVSPIRSCAPWRPSGRQSGGATQGRSGGCDVHRAQPPGRHSAGGFALLAPAFMALDGWLRFHDMIPRQLEDWLPGLDTHPAGKLPDLSVDPGFRRVLAPPPVPHLGLVVGSAWHPPLPAADVVLDGLPQSPAGRPDRRYLVRGPVLLIGVPPGHFIGLLVTLRLVENLSHTNTRLGFGRLGDYLIVGPRYHRWHHAIDLPEGEALSPWLQFRDPATGLGCAFRHPCTSARNFPRQASTKTVPRQSPPATISGANRSWGSYCCGGLLTPRRRQISCDVTRTPRRPDRARGGSSASPWPAHPAEADAR